MPDMPTGVPARSYRIPRRPSTLPLVTQSVAARRQRLVPLVTALEARPSNDTQELTQLARKIIVNRI